MKIFNIQAIRSWNPCYDPGKYLPENWQGTALDILRMENVPADDRLWVVLREDVLDLKTLRLFAVWCARQALALIDNPDPRSIQACNVAERYAHGEATEEELEAAYEDAEDAAEAAADAYDAARRAAAFAAAARRAARDAAEAAARRAARDAAEAAAYLATYEVAYAARCAAHAAYAAARYDDAWSAVHSARKAQIQHLIEMIES